MKIFTVAVLATLFFFLTLSTPPSRVTKEIEYAPQENDAAQIVLEEVSEPMVVKNQYKEILPTEQPEAIVEKTGQEAGEDLTAYLVDSLDQLTINKSSIVAIQCVWDYTYPENVQEDSRFHSETYFQGSGVIISEDGYILTVNHVLDADLGKEPDPLGKKWFLKECVAAPTDINSAPLAYDSPRFKKTEIIFQPTHEEYDYDSEDRVDFDFALLKFKEPGNYAFTLLLPGLIDSENKEKSMFLMGYPGAALTGQREFKTLEFFTTLEKYRGLGVGSDALFYQAGSKKYTASSESYKKFQEDLFASGQDNRLVRGGFSGSPVFVQGHLVGITISSSLPYVEEQDTMLILSSYSISESLKKNGFSNL